MTVALDSLLKGHIKRGIVSVPLGTTLQYSTEPLLESKIKLVCKYLYYVIPNCVSYNLHVINFRVIEGAAYNLPDPPAESAAREILQLVQEASDGDLVIALVSGGGSALLPVPETGISLEDKRKVSSLHDYGAGFSIAAIM